MAKTRWLAVLATSAVLIQLVLGALMRHTASGLAIPDFPLSYSQWMPPTDISEMAALNDYRLTYYDLPPVELSQIWIHVAHRLGALLVTIVVLANVVHVVRNYRIPQMREPAIVQGMLLLVQFLLGALTVWTGKGVQVSTAHVAVGALLLGTSVALSVYSFGWFTLPEHKTQESLAAEVNPA